MLKRSGIAITLAAASALLLVGCTSVPTTGERTAAPSRSSQPSASASLPGAVKTPRASATPSSTPTYKGPSVKSLIPKLRPSSSPIPTGKAIPKGAAVNLAASAVAHWKKDTVVEPDITTWQQSGDTGTMRGTIITGKGVGQRYIFKLSKQGSTWRVDSATAS
jgi:hypothetical protein